MYSWSPTALLILLSIVALSASIPLTPKEEGASYEIFEHNGLDYVFVFNKTTWHEANLSCIYRWGGRLLESADTPLLNLTLGFLFPALEQSNYHVDDSFWINLRMINDTPYWLQPPIHELENTSFCWNNNGTCGVLSRVHYDDYCVDLIDCKARRSYICQNEGNYTSTHADWIKEGQYFYKIFSTRMSYADANTACMRYDNQAKLAVFPDLSHAFSVARFLQIGRPRLERVWIGDNVRRINESFYDGYETCTRIVKQKCKTGCWYIDKQHDSYNCSAVSAKTTCARCDLFRPYICQKHLHGETIDVCHSDAWNDTDYDWRVYYTPQTWMDAQRVCKNVKSGRLAVAETQEVFNIIINLMASLELGLAHVWLGARETKIAGWAWLNGTSLPKEMGSDGYPPWGLESQNLPSERKRRITCLNLDRYNVNSARIYGASCNYPQPFLCQYDKGTICKAGEANRSP